MIEVIEQLIASTNRVIGKVNKLMGIRCSTSKTESMRGNKESEDANASNAKDKLNKGVNNEAENSEENCEDESIQGKQEDFKEENSSDIDIEELVEIIQMQCLEIMKKDDGIRRVEDFDNVLAEQMNTLMKKLHDYKKTSNKLQKEVQMKKKIRFSERRL